MIPNYGISPQFIFGVRSDIKESLHFWDERKLVYVAGHNVVDYNMEENQQKFYSPTEGSLSITSLTMSTQRALMAFAETQKTKGPMVHIYDKTQRKRRTLIPTAVHAATVLSMAFATTKDERNILVLYGPPEYALIYWRWDSSTCEATLSLNAPVESAKCSFCPAEPSICVLTGQNVFRFLRIESKGEGKGDSLMFTVVQTSIKAKDGTEPVHSHEYLSHCWIADTILIVGTDKGELLALDVAGQFIAMAKLSSKVDCLTSYSRGIIAGCSEPCIYAIGFNRDDTVEPFKIQEKYTLGKLGKPGDTLTSLAVKPNVEGMIVCTMSNKQLLKVGITSKKVQKLICGFHSKGILGLDVCVRKPLIVTCSEDGTVRLWNYLEKRQEFRFKKSDMNPQSVAFHPSGLHVVVGCLDKVYIMNVYLKTLKPALQELTIKQFKEVSFSHGGHYLAVSHSSMVQVFNFYTMELVSQPPPTPVKVQAISWYEDDTGYVTNDQGFYFSFCGLDGQSTQIITNSKLTMSSVLKIPDTLAALGACSDQVIREATKDVVTEKLQVTGNPSQIAMTRNQKLFFVGIGEPKAPGTVKYYKYPLSAGECSEVQAHSEEIKRMKISRDDKYLFTAGKDGCVIVYEIKEREKTRETKELGLMYSEEILTDKQELNDIQQKLEDVKNKNKDLLNQKGITQDSDLGKLTKRIKEVIDETRQKKTDYNDDYTRAQNDLATLKSTREEERKRKIQSNSDELDKLKRTHLEEQSQRATEYSKKDLEKGNLIKSQESKKEQRIEELEQDIAKTRAQNQQNLEKLRAEVEQKRKERDNRQENHKEIMDQITVDSSKEVDTMKNAHETELQKKNEQVVKLRGECQVNANKIEEHTRRFGELQRDIKEINDSLDKAANEEEKIHQENARESKRLIEKSEEISKLEQKIYNYKKEAQKLEKFKFVLDYKIKELKREINPREQQIEALRKKTTEMDKRLKKFNKLNVFLGFRLKELQETQRIMQTNITNNREKLRKNAISMKESIDALDYCVQFIHSPDKLKEAVLKKLESYKKEGEQATKLPSTISHEFKNQEEFMASSVKTLEKELEASKKIRKDSNKMIRGQNKLLIMEIQRLRGTVGGTKGVAPVPGQKTIMRSTRMTPHSTVSRRGIDDAEDYGKQLESNKETIRMLRTKIEELKSENAQLKTMKQLPV